MTHALFTTYAAIDPSKAVGHVVNHKFPGLTTDVWYWSAICTNLVLSAIILMLVGSWAAKRISTGPESQGHDRFITRNPFAHLLEVICVYLREDAVRPLLHDRTEKFMPFLWTLFFFILVNNLLGLVPLLDIQHALSPDLKKSHTAFVGGTATQSIWVTAALATIAGIVINAAGVARLGVLGYLKHLTGGVPLTIPFLPIVAIVIVVEIIGTFVKPVALAIRLFANMTAGHILLATMFALTIAGWSLGAGGATLVLILTSAAAFAIYLLEIFVALLQAFIFFFLTTVFISLLDHHDEEHEHEEHAHADETPALATA